MEPTRQQDELKGKTDRINTLSAGILIGILVAGMAYGLVLLLFYLVPAIGKSITDQRIQLFLAMVPNLLLMRYYLVSRKMEKTGKGILLVTFIGIVGAFFVF